MSFLTVRHATVYRYSQPVGLGEHRMMFRPRESHDLRLIRTSLALFFGAILLLATAGDIRMLARG